MRTQVCIVGVLSAVAAAHPNAANCSTRYFSNLIDHFSWATLPFKNTSWEQKVLVCGEEWFDPLSGAIFFYSGNEGDVELYANNTGLMWENAPEFHALLIFAQHRLWAPGSVVTNQTVQYLSSSQALADYSVLLRSLQLEFAPPGLRLPVISFGGSYGGVLSAMFRSKYPGSVDGAISSSAPLRAFPGQSPSWDSSSYYEVITYDTSEAGGSAPACEGNLRQLWPAIFSAAKTSAGLKTLASQFQTCAPLTDEDDALALAFWIRDNFDTMSMGNYPYPSSYMTGGAAMLPAFPVRVACGFLADPSLPSNPAALFAAVRQAAAVYANSTADQSCFDVPPNPYTHPAEPVDGLWDWQHCTELQPDSFWFAANGVTDAFWPQPYNQTFISEHCAAAWNVTPSYDWMTTAYGLPDFSGVSNIVFASGEYDPWGSAGIKQSPAPERSLIVVNVTGGAHHLDLMFSNPLDTPGVIAARLVEVAAIRSWLAAADRRGSVQVSTGL